MRFGIDLDGCCFDFGESLRSWLVRFRGYDAAKLTEPTGWTFYEEWGMSLATFVEECNAAADAGWLFQGVPARGSADAIRWLYNKGHEVHIITDRHFGAGPFVSHELTREWLYLWKIPYTSLTFSADKTVVPCDYFVEDKPENYLALTRAGTTTYLVDQPWNRGTFAWTRAWTSGRLVRGVAHYVESALLDARLQGAA